MAATLNAYTPAEATQLVADACERIAQGDTVADAAETAGIDRGTLWRLKERSDELRDAYARARSLSAESYDDEALALARRIVADENATSEQIAAARVLIDQLKWTAGKRRPREYGDKVDVTSGDKPLAATQVIVIGDKRIEF